MNSQELLYVIDLVAKEKDVEREDIFKTVEEAMVLIAKEKYGKETILNATINRQSGQVGLSRIVHVVEKVENPFQEIDFDQARHLSSTANMDDELFEALPMIEFGRADASLVRKFIIEKIRLIERERQYEEF